MAQQNVAFVGIGNMGYHMAGHLRKKLPPSVTLYIVDVNKDACDRFIKDFGSFGPVEVAQTPKEAATHSKTIFSIVPMAKHVVQVYLDKETGVINAPKDPERLFLECSTIDIKTTRDVGRQIEEAGIGKYIDSPVSGGAFGAEAANLSFLVGCPEDDPLAKRITELVTLMGPADKLIFCGSLGTGLASKICNNYISCTAMLQVAEAMATGIRHGVDRKVLYRCIKASSGNSWVLDNMQPCPGVVAHSPASQGFRPTFKPVMICKDTSLAVQAARDVGITASIGETALKLYQQADDDPRTKDLDCTSVWLHVNQELS